MLVPDADSVTACAEGTRRAVADSVVNSSALAVGNESADSTALAVGNERACPDQRQARKLTDRKARSVADVSAWHGLIAR